MIHHTKNKGDVALTQVIAQLTEVDYYVCLPISEHLPFDLIVYSNNLIDSKRIQVKYRGSVNGSINLPLHNCYNDKNGSHSIDHDFNHFDTYALYCPDNKQIYYIHNWEILTSSNINIKIDIPKNFQTIGIQFGQYFDNVHRLFQSKEEIEIYKIKNI